MLLPGAGPGGTTRLHLTEVVLVLGYINNRIVISNDVRHNRYPEKDSSSPSKLQREVHSMVSLSNPHPYSFAHTYPNNTGSRSTRGEDRQHQNKVYGHSDGHQSSTIKTEGHVLISSRNATAIIIPIDTDFTTFGSF